METQNGKLNYKERNRTFYNTDNNEYISIVFFLFA